jgi:hypothetical protein
MVYFINPVFFAVCASLNFARRGLDKNIKNVTNTNGTNRKVVGRIVLYAVSVMFKARRRLILPRTACS